MISRTVDSKKRVNVAKKMPWYNKNGIVLILEVRESVGFALTNPELGLPFVIGLINPEVLNAFFDAGSRHGSSYEFQQWLNNLKSLFSHYNSISQNDDTTDDEERGRNIDNQGRIILPKSASEILGNKNCSKVQIVPVLPNFGNNAIMADSSLLLPDIPLEGEFAILNSRVHWIFDHIARGVGAQTIFAQWQAHIASRGAK